VSSNSAAARLISAGWLLSFDTAPRRPYKLRTAVGSILKLRVVVAIQIAYFPPLRCVLRSVAIVGCNRKLTIVWATGLITVRNAGHLAVEWCCYFDVMTVFVNDCCASAHTS